MGDSETTYIVQQGDHLAALAARYNFDADEVWKDPQHDPLRKAGRTPNTLVEGDVLYLPPPKKNWLPCTLGSSNTFSAKPATTDVTLVLTFEGKPLANESCIVHVRPPATMTTDGSGTLKLTVPLQTKEVVVEIPRIHAVETFGVGHLDPVTTPSGVRQRLANLDHSPFGQADLHDPARLAAAISRFQTSQGITATGVLDDATRTALSNAHGS